jgi:hypothetical protein
MSTDARDPHAHDEMPISQSARSATERSRAPSQRSTAILNRMQSPLQAPIGRTNAATPSDSASLAEPQNFGSAAQRVDSAESSTRSETAPAANRRTLPLVDSAMAQPVRQAIPGRAGALIGQPASHRSRVALPESLPRLRNMVPRRERMTDATHTTSVRTAPAAENSQIPSSNTDARPGPTTGIEIASVGTEHAPAQATTARGMALTAERMKSIVSCPPKIRFHVQFPAPEAREGQTVYRFLSRMIGERNAAVPADHSRMINRHFTLGNEWLLIHDNSDVAVLGMESVPYPGKSFSSISILSGVIYISELTNNPECLLLSSPEFTFYPDQSPSNWQEEFRVTWNFFRQRYGCLDGGNFRTKTEILLEPPSDLAEFKRTSQAVIHFKPILDMFVSNLDPGREAARSGTEVGDLHPENSPRARREAIMAIEDIRDTQALRRNVGYASSWALADRIRFSQYREVFCVAPHSKTADDVIFWAEFAMTFVEASISCEVSQLLRFPPNQIGLSLFLANRGWGTENLYRQNVRLIRLFRGESGRGEPRPR